MHERQPACWTRRCHEIPFVPFLRLSCIHFFGIIEDLDNLLTVAINLIHRIHRIEPLPSVMEKPYVSGLDRFGSKGNPRSQGDC